MKTIIIKSFALFASVGLSVTAFADMQPLAEAELQEATGQQGINMSAKLEFAPNTRLSFANPDADYKNPLPNGQHYWLVVNNLTGSVELKNMKTEYTIIKTDLVDPTKNVGAVVTTLPESIEFDNLRTDGIYLGPGKEVGPNHRFIMGVEINGKLEMPAATTMTVFAIE